MPFEISYAFTIFLVTMGPIGAIPRFALISADLDGPATRALALRGILLAAFLAAITALVVSGTMESWRVSVPALQIAGALLLYGSASKNVTTGLANAPSGPAPGHSAPQKSFDAEVKARALTPLAVPAIVSPTGIVAILLFVGLAKGDSPLLMQVYGLLALILALNFVGMLLAKRLIAYVGFTVFQIMGWIMSVLQAGLAVQTLLGALRTLKIIPA
ncbi:MAG: MarC family protein [Bryobacteraceae bacterium]|nr:MarC family protein [Bryobacteraceae bacterium]